MTGLMRPYVERFLRMKIENSGKLTALECKEINEYHKTIGLNIEILPENTCFNAGKRKVAKICLNSLWGKFGQRSVLEQYDFARNFTEFTRLVSSPGSVVTNYEIISKKLVEVRYKDDADNVNESEHICEIIASFTTSNARLRLYAFVDWLHPSQILYMDTDSCIYLYDPDHPGHINPDDTAQQFPDKVSLGSGLGQWSNELEPADKDPVKGSTVLRPAEYITQFVATGPKSYAYITNRGHRVCKAKGFTLDRTSAKLITIESMKKLIDDSVEEGKPIPFVESAERFHFGMNKITEEMTTTYI